MISPDLRISRIRSLATGRVARRHTLKPGQLVELELNRQFDIPVHSSGYLPIPQISARSIAARLGVQAGVGQHSLAEIYGSGKTPKRILLTHFGTVPLRLSQGNRIGRFYFQQLATPLKQSEIKGMMKRGELRLGKDCKIHPSGIVEIKTHKVVYEVPDELVGKIARKNWLSGSGRDKLMGMLRKVEKPVKTSARHIVLTETLPVKLPENVAMFFQGTTDGTSFHISSHLIDPGFKGPIVMELQGLVQGKKPDNVLALLGKIE
ncbi:MAG: hypothetical protein QT12_C0001G0006 [archaeon GW2011_AR21]|nr:MAG: hypothetical protein QT12_C0001G0006 [archaeon GW2011_AR21]